MAWFWLAIIGALIPAYYGVYVYAFGLRRRRPATCGSGSGLAGWLAAVLFLWIGFTFANAMSLMENVGGWPDLWEDHGFHGAALGTALNVADRGFGRVGC